jgi:hypothetical protein
LQVSRLIALALLMTVGNSLAFAQSKDAPPPSPFAPPDV